MSLLLRGNAKPSEGSAKWLEVKFLTSWWLYPFVILFWISSRFEFLGWKHFDDTKHLLRSVDRIYCISRRRRFQWL
jgi:hypothetical protein